MAAQSNANQQNRPKLYALQSLAIAALAVPALLLSLYAFFSYREHHAKAEQRLDATLALIHEHGSKVFDTYELLASYADELLRGLSDDEIRTQEPALNEKLARFKQVLPQVQDIWIVGADGKPLVTANVFPAPRTLDLSDRGYVQAAKANESIYISEVLRGRAQDVAFFQFSRRRASPDGTYRGVIAVSVQPDYFRSYFAQVGSASVSTAALIRSDGVILSRYPGLPSGRVELGPTTDFGQAIARQPERGVFTNVAVIDGKSRLVAYQRLPRYPVYLTTALDLSTVRSAWLDSLLVPLAFGVPGALGLFALTQVAIRHTRRERQTLARLQDEVARRETAEAERQEANARYRAYFANSPESLFVVRVHPDGSFTYVEHNPTNERATGLQSADVVGREPHSFLPAEAAAVITANYRRCVEARAPIQYEEELALPGGTRLWDTGLAPIFDAEGRVAFVIGSSRDITERRRIEDVLRQAQRMEAMGQLSAGVAHDFNNILQVVVGSLDMLKRAPEERRSRLLDNAQRAAEQGRKITAQLLAFGRRQTLKPEVIALNLLVAGMDDMLAQTLRGDIRLELDLADDLWPVELDVGQLQTALINLAANARDAMPDGGALVVRTHNTLQRDDGSRRESVALTVSDTGSGMPRDVLARLGEPFFTTKKESGRGNGLGLAQVFGFVHQTGGSVEVHSEPGRGTSVTLNFPKSIAGSRAAVEDSPKARVAVQPLRILLVEDNPEVAEVGEGLLVQQGHSVAHVPSADEAVHLLGRTETPPFDLIVSDLVMPGEQDGLDLALLVRERHPGLPFLLVTGYSDAASRAAQEGFPLLTKPFTAEALTTTIANVTSDFRASDQDKVVSLTGKARLTR